MSSGTIVAIEPVYVVRPNDKALYWKFTVTNVDHSGISATAVSDSARPDDIKVFQHRKEFEAWLHGNEVVPASAEAKGAPREKILKLIEDLARQLSDLKREAEGLKN